MSLEPVCTARHWHIQLMMSCKCPRAVLPLASGVIYTTVSSSELTAANSQGRYLGLHYTVKYSRSGVTTVFVLVHQLFFKLMPLFWSYQSLGRELDCRDCQASVISRMQLSLTNFVASIHPVYWQVGMVRSLPTGMVNRREPNVLAMAASILYEQRNSAVTHSDLPGIV